MQAYFRTGKTLVIDDQYNEARPLLDALSKNQIPFFYTQGKPHSDFPLPNSDPKDSQFYNLIFLDLNLDFKFAGSQIGNDTEEKTFKGTHAQILNTILRNDNRSFIIVIWSNEEENFSDHFLKLFEDDKYTKKRPYKVISLKKSNYFLLTEKGYEFKKDNNGHTKPFEESLFKEVMNALKDLEGFKLFCEWDYVVSQSAGETIDDFMSLVNEIANDGQREEYIAKILTLVSISYSGWEGFLGFKTDEERTDSFMLALTQILNDDIDWNVLNKRQSEFKNWRAKTKKDIEGLYEEINHSLLNKKLLICYPNRKDLTGSVYKLSETSKELRRILRDCMHLDLVSKTFIKYKKGRDEDRKKDAQSDFFLDFIVARLTPIEVNVTPLCDIVQNKYINHRILSGFLASAKYSDCIKKSDLAFFYKSPIFSFEDRDVFIGLDLRSFGSCPAEEIESKSYLFTFRTNLTNDIQTRLAAHVSRLGVLNL